MLLLLIFSFNLINCINVRSINDFCTSLTFICNKDFDREGYYHNVTDCVDHFLNVDRNETDDFTWFTGNSTSCRYYYHILSRMTPKIYCIIAGKIGDNKCNSPHIFNEECDLETNSCKGILDTSYLWCFICKIDSYLRVIFGKGIDSECKNGLPIHKYYYYEFNENEQIFKKNEQRSRLIASIIDSDISTHIGLMMGLILFYAIVAFLAVIVGFIVGFIHTYNYIKNKIK